MELYLQFGHGMMEHTRHLLSRWNGGTVVLSPRDLDDGQLSRLAGDVNALPNANVLLDPQFYMPHASHERLCSHSFWPGNYDTNVFWQSPALATLLGNLLTLNQRLNSRGIILPGLLATVVDDDWLEVQRAILEEATALTTQLPRFGTIALSAESTRDENQVALLLERIAIWQQAYNPTGYYIVCEHPNGDYLVEPVLFTLRFYPSTSV